MGEVRDGASVRREEPVAPEVILDTLPLSDLTFPEVVRLIGAWAKDGSGGYVTTPNVDYVVRARRDPEFREALLGARLRVPDGMGVVYGSYLTGRPLRGSITGRLLPQGIVEATPVGGASIALVGGRPGAARKAARRLSAAGGQIVAAIEPSMAFQYGSEEDDAIVDALRGSRAQILFVGLGAPKQELWMAKHTGDLPSTVMVGIGQGIDVLGGAVASAPSWMTRIGIEWAYRLVREPRRLARRYLWEDPRFFWWMLRSRSAATRNHPTDATDAGRDSGVPGAS